MSVNRYIQDYSVIGIRPTIDGRRGVLGVRESLEEQTMNMAKSAAKLFTENLKYSNGEPVKVTAKLTDTAFHCIAMSVVVLNIRKLMLSLPQFLKQHFLYFGFFEFSFIQ